MSAQSFREMLDGVTPSEALSVDTSALDRFKATGELPAHEEPEVVPEIDGDEREPEVDADEVDAELSLEDEDRERDLDEEDDLDVEPETEDERSTHGGSDGSSGNGAVADAVVAAAPGAEPDHAEAHPEPDDPEHDEDESAAAGEETLTAPAAAVVERKEVISAHRKSDQQDAIQAASTKRTGGSSGDGPLPRSGFSLPQASSAPLVRNLPVEITQALRQLIKTAAIREYAVSERDAATFADQLSQSALAVAFLLARLDVRMETDEATAVAIELFRSEDPLLGAAVARMDALEEREAERDRLLARLARTTAQTQATTDVIEQALAFSIADRTQNISKGVYLVRDLPLTHRVAVELRDRAREDTRKLSRREKDREGRPIR